MNGWYLEKDLTRTTWLIVFGGIAWWMHPLILTFLPLDFNIYRWGARLSLHLKNMANWVLIVSIHFGVKLCPLDFGFSIFNLVISCCKPNLTKSNPFPWHNWLKLMCYIGCLNFEVLITLYMVTHTYIFTQDFYSWSFLLCLVSFYGLIQLSHPTQL